MIHGTREEIATQLEKFFNFQECILLDLRLLHPGLDLALTVSYIWDEKWGVLAESPRKIELRLYDVERCCLHGELNEAVLDDRTRVGWGFAEFAIIELSESSEVDPLGRDRHSLSVLWESERRIEIQFSRLRIRDLGAVTSDDERASV